MTNTFQRRRDDTTVAGGDNLVGCSPVELVNVLDVPKEEADLLRADAQLRLVDNVRQVVLAKRDTLALWETVLKLPPPPPPLTQPLTSTIIRKSLTYILSVSMISETTRSRYVSAMMAVGRRGVRWLRPLHSHGSAPPFSRLTSGRRAARDRPDPGEGEEKGRSGHERVGSPAPPQDVRNSAGR